MKKERLFVIAVLFAVITLFISTDLSAQERELLPKGDVKTKTKERRPLDELTEGELIERIAEELDYYEEILDFVPQLKMNKDNEGNIFYTYRLESGIVKRLEELDKATLVKLLRKVSNEANRLNTERIIRELERLRQVQDIPKLPAQPPEATTPIRIPLLPEVHTPPKTPTTPPSTTQPSRPPTEPSRR